MNLQDFITYSLDVKIYCFSPYFLYMIRVSRKRLLQFYVLTAIYAPHTHTKVPTYM